MSERERTIIRLVGLIVHGLGLVSIVATLAGVVGSLPLLAGLVAFVVGGAWGWGMVWLAQHEAEQRRIAAAAAIERERAWRDRKGFTSSFDDEPEPIGPPPGQPLGPPNGLIGG